MGQTKSPGVIGAYHAALERFWHPVLPADSLSDAPVGIELLGRGLALARLDGEVVAFDDVCRHLGAALSIGEVVGEGCYLRCAYHGWSYDKTGRCVDIPARRGTSIPREARVRSYPAREAYARAAPGHHPRTGPPGSQEPAPTAPPVPQFPHDALRAPCRPAPRRLPEADRGAPHPPGGIA